MARRLGSAMTAKVDSMVLNILMEEYECQGMYGGSFERENSDDETIASKRLAALSTCHTFRGFPLIKA